jgi:hypothetical protein
LFDLKYDPSIIEIPVPRYFKEDDRIPVDVEFKEKFPFIYSPLKNIANNPEMNELLDNNLKKYNFDGYFSNRFSQDDIIKIAQQCNFIPISQINMVNDEYQHIYIFEKIM